MITHLGAGEKMSKLRGHTNDVKIHHSPRQLKIENSFFLSVDEIPSFKKIKTEFRKGETVSIFLYKSVRLDQNSPALMILC